MPARVRTTAVPAGASPAVASAHIDAVRAFNRFHTRAVGALDEDLLDSGFSLTQVRVLYELAQRAESVASQLGDTLGIDSGYLSRILKGFRRNGLIAVRPAGDDRRRHALALTAHGRKALAPLQAAARDQARRWLAPLSPHDRQSVVQAMATLHRLLSHLEPEAALPARPAAATVVLRGHRPGDMGWVVQRHAVLYAREYGWDQRFEAMIAGIVARFIERFDATGERCWIAERDGEPLGSVFVVRHSRKVAQLRLLLVEPSARGLGLGRTLVREAIRFAREAGYRRMVLWTNDVLDAARHIYQQEGFVLTRSEPHRSFGHALVGQYWSLDLAPRA
jgi:DNA-binding MarR family transcriptional regulator/GNAT superfamily N-acetyltransferase